MLKLNHKTSYIWPNPAFPFREYFIHENLRLFIIENIHHNWQWLRDHSRRFQARDHFIVYVGWYFDDWFLQQDLAVFDALNLDKNKFFFLFNSKDEMLRYKEAGFNGELINQNTWLDSDGIMSPNPNVIKKYNAIYVGRLTPFKRHELAANVDNLALVAGNLHGGLSSNEIPPNIYINNNELTPIEVSQKINESFCGLILSASEGACFASSEYLLCGVPVVSTYSKGGRDEWYNNYNSIQVSADPLLIKEAVDFFVNNPRDPYKIRNDHLAQAEKYKQKFIDYLTDLFNNYSVNQSANQFYNDTYMHKLRKSENPDFIKIWPN